MPGVKNADENELKEIASEPDSTHVYNVADFSFMNSIVEGLTKTVCSRVEEQEKEIKGINEDFENVIVQILHKPIYFKIVGGGLWPNKIAHPC